MKETGVIRRIDELGRIVIPKEIRKRLRVSSGDFLDIFTNDKEIILTKYSPLSEVRLSLEKLVLAIKEETKSDIIVLDKTKVITSTSTVINADDEVSEQFVKMIGAKEEIELLKTTGIKITANYENNRSLFAKRIINNGDYVGCIVIINEGIISKADRDIANILKRYVLNSIVADL